MDLACTTAPTQTMLEFAVYDYVRYFHACAYTYTEKQSLTWASYACGEGIETIFFGGGGGIS